MRTCLGLIALFALTFSVPTSADELREQDIIDQECEELWFSRNAMMNKAGFCFSSPLGQEIFDNSDCDTTEPQFDDLQLAIIDMIVREEIDRSCAIDNRATASGLSPINGMASRLNLTVQPPVPGFGELEWTCLWYKGETRTLHAAPETGAEIVSMLRDGDHLDFDHDIEITRQGSEFKIYEYGFQAETDIGIKNRSSWKYAGVILPGSEGQANWGWIESPSSNYFSSPIEDGGVCRNIAG